MTQHTQTRFARFAVIDAAGVYLADGGRMALPTFQQLGYWLDAAQRRQIDTLWLHPSAPWRWRDADIDACTPWIVAGSAGGCIDGIEIGEPWWTATRPGVYGVRDVVQPRYEDRAPWRQTPDAPTLRASLLAFRDAVGIEWRRSPGATGTRLLRQLHSGKTATKLELDGPPPPPASEKLNRDGGHLDWTRPLAASERGLYLHSYDVNGQYLAACSSLPLGVGPWQHHSRVALPEKPAEYLPGYYRVRVTEKPVSGPCPSLCAETLGWVTTPTLRLLREAGAQVHILECYTWFESKRYLEPWYKTLRDARARLSGDASDPYALDAVKGLYRHAIGWFGSETWDRSEDTLYRPDWAHQVRALARANVLRTVYRVGANYGLWPLAVGSDCVYYLSSSPDPLAMLGVTLITGQGAAATDGVRVSRQLGHFKIKDAGVPVAELAPFLGGRRWSLTPLQEALNTRAGRVNRPRFVDPLEVA